MEALKQAANTAVQQVTKTVDALKPASAPGEFPKPHEFPTQTQRGKVVGIESEMKPLPHYKTMEADGGFADYKPAGKLIGKKAIITGGDSGIGRAVAVMYAMEGADVAIVYLPEEEGDAQLVKQVVEKYGRRCLCIPKDISVEDNCKTIVTQVLAAFGTIDVLVNNASVMYMQESITDITTEQFDRTMKTNIYGTFFLTKYVVPHLKRGASIIQTTSQVAYMGVGTILDYSMTKSAMLGLTRALANQLLEKGIRVNSVAPGPVWTPLQPAAMTAEQLDKWQKEPAPIGRIGQPSECGPAYVFLASNDASFITGQSIHVNGGCIVNG